MGHTLYSYQKWNEWVLEEGDCRWVNSNEFPSSFLEGASFSGMSSLVDGQPNHVGFYFSGEYRSELSGTKVGLLITSDRFLDDVRQAAPTLFSRAVIWSVRDPAKVMLKLCRVVARAESTVSHLALPESSQIHPSAVIPSSVVLGQNIEIGAGVVLSEGVQIASGVRIYPGCFVGPNVSIGEGTVLFPNVTIYELVSMGARCRIHSGTVIGTDGFGYIPCRDPNLVGPVIHQKIYHLGLVRIGDDVEIGAGCTVDRATLGVTEIGSGTKIDNQVHVGHNCKIGRSVIICGASVFAGGVVVEDEVMIGGLCGFDNRITIGRGALVGGGSIVTNDVAAGTQVAGNPHQLKRDYLRSNAVLRRLSKSGKSTRK